MNKLITFLLGLFIATNLIAQDDNDDFKTILGSGDITISGFGGPFMSFSAIGDDFVHEMGGGGGIILNNLFIGGYGIGKTNTIPYKEEEGDAEDYDLDFGHGGFWLGYTFMPNKAIHPVVHSTFGWGSLLKNEKNEYAPDIIESRNSVFVICPTIELEMNFARYFKLGIGANYRLVYGLNNTPYSFSDFAKPGGFISFKFGWF